MTNQEILEKAIQKARKNGWKPGDFIRSGLMLNFKEFAPHKDAAPIGWWDYEEHLEVNTLIFNHDFAKALWGEEWNLPSPVPGQRIVDGRNVHAKLTKGEPWRYHLQQMVIADDPIKYLGENI